MKLGYDAAENATSLPSAGRFLAKFYDYANAQRYNLDGTPKAGESPSFSVVDAQVL